MIQFASIEILKETEIKQKQERRRKDLTGKPDIAGQREEKFGEAKAKLRSRNAWAMSESDKLK